MPMNWNVETARFYDEHEVVLTLSCRLVQGEFGDEEVFGLVLDGAPAVWGVACEVDGRGDGGVEGGALEGESGRHPHSTFDLFYFSWRRYLVPCEFV
jgi:hypothetical protein